MPLLERLGLHRPELRAWAMYDWAQSGLIVVVMTAVYPTYFSTVVASDRPAADATQLHAYANTIAMVAIALLSPVLGAVADYASAKKRFLGIFMGIGVSAVACMYFVQQGDVALAMSLFVVSIVGATGSFVFYESLLPHIAHAEEMDRVSTAGYALGYVGGGILLAANLLLIMRPDLFGLPAGEGLTPGQRTLPVRIAFLSVAVWWVLFSIPTFLGVREPPVGLEPDEQQGLNPLRVAFTRLRETLGEIRGYRQAFLMLLAFLIYNDGIQTIIKMAPIYGAEIGIATGSLIAAVLIVQFVGIPFTFLFGMIAGRVGAKRSIFAGLMAYTAIAIVGFFMRTATHFYMLALLVGMVQGGTQALSRSLFASMIPKHKSAEFFGFYSVFEKFAGIFGPLLFALAIELTGTSRAAILSVILFFAIGAWILSRVNVAEGRRVAQAADSEVRTVAA